MIAHPRLWAWTMVLTVTLRVFGFRSLAFMWAYANWVAAFRSVQGAKQ